MANARERDMPTVLTGQNIGCPAQLQPMLESESVCSLSPSPSTSNPPLSLVYYAFSVVLKKMYRVSKNRILFFFFTHGITFFVVFRYGYMLDLGIAY